MNVFTINAASIKTIKAASLRQAAECKAAIESDNCGHDCSQCRIAEIVPNYGWADVDRYTATSVGALGGVVEVMVKNGEVYLMGTKGRFAVDLKNGHIHLTML